MGKKTQVMQKQRVVLVLQRLAALANEDEDFAESLSDDLTVMLDDIHGQDGFGTEGQSDPRGDFRDGQWRMDRVQSLDK